MARKPTIAEQQDLLRSFLALTEGVLAKARTPERLSAGLGRAYAARAIPVVKGILLLSEHGLGGEIGSLGRVLVEGSYYALWILKKAGPDNKSQVEREPAEIEARAQDVCDAQDFEDAKTFEAWGKRGYVKGSTEAAKTLADEARKRRGLSGTASYKLKVRDLAKESGGDPGEENYDLFYRTLCFDAHPTLHSAIRLLDETKDPVFWHERSLYFATAAATLLLDSAFRLMGVEDATIGQLHDAMNKTYEYA